MKLKSFQKQDLARAALHDGLIIGWDTGLGKTWAMFLWPMLKCGWVRADGAIIPAAPVLIVAPGDLHEQITAEAWANFRIRVVPMPSQAEFFRLTSTTESGNSALCTPHSPLPHGLTRMTEDGKPILPPRFYITSYTQLSVNGVRHLPDPEDCDPLAMLHELLLPKNATSHCDRPEDSAGPADLFRLRRVQWKAAYQYFEADHFTTRGQLDRLWQRALADLDTWQDPRAAAAKRRMIEPLYQTLCALTTEKANPAFQDLDPIQQNFVIRAFLVLKMEQYSEGIGAIRRYDLPNSVPGSAGRAGVPPAVIPTGRPGVPPEDEGRDEEPGEPAVRAREIKCVYSPSLSDLSYRAFACVVVDEGVKMKGEATLVGLGVRAMQPEYRLVSSATAIKNRLPDIFRLAFWAAGALAEAHARWPYADKSSERDSFARTFLVSERNISKEADAKANGKSYGSRYTKLTPQVCNIHRLWKLFGPLILRRRKKDCGEEIVRKIHHVFRVQMGEEQKNVYEYHIRAIYQDKNGLPAIGAQLQALRMAAVSPAAHNLENKGEVMKNITLPNGTKSQIALPYRSSDPFIPKIATVLNLVETILARNEQVMIFSAFKESLVDLGRYLTQSGVRHAVLTGDVSQRARGAVMTIFKQGPPSPTALAEPQSSRFPLELSARVCVATGFDPVSDGARIAAVNAKRSDSPQPAPELSARVCVETGSMARREERSMSGTCETRSNEARHPVSTQTRTGRSLPVILASIEAMAEGHSCPLANNVILISYPWALDKLRQAIDRCYRLISHKDVNVYSVLCEGTIDKKLESNIRDKGDASDLVLDGELMGEIPEEMNLFDLLKIAKEDFSQETQTIDEAALRREWPALQSRLKAAQQHWDGEIKVGRGVSAEPLAPKAFGVDPAPVSSTLHSEPVRTIMHSTPTPNSTSSLDHLFPNLTIPVCRAKAPREVRPGEPIPVEPPASAASTFSNATTTAPALRWPARKTTTPIPLGKEPPRRRSSIERRRGKSRAAHCGTVAAVFDPFASEPIQAVVQAEPARVGQHVPDSSRRATEEVVSSGVAPSEAVVPVALPAKPATSLILTPHSAISTPNSSAPANIIPFPTSPASLALCAPLRPLREAGLSPDSEWRDRLRRMRLAYT